MDLFERYYNRAIWYLSRRPRSEKEIRDKLVEKKAPPEIIEKVIQKLTQQKFLNDFEFTRWWIDQRSKFRPRSLRLLKLELKQKGISNEVLEIVLSDRTSEEIKVNDMDSARKLVEKKFPKYKGMERQVIYQKLGGFLARRGYSWDTIKAAIDEIMAKGV